MGGIRRFNLTPASGAPFTLGSANNGLSVDPVTGIIQLGQTIGAVGDPAVLLHNTEIPMGGFDFTMRDGVFRKFVIENTLKRYRFGDMDGNGNGMSLQIFDNVRQISLGDVAGVGNSMTAFIDDSIRRFQVGDINGNYLDLDAVGNVYSLGDINGAVNNTFVRVNDGGKQFVFTASDGTITWISAGTMEMIFNPNTATSRILFQLAGANRFLLIDRVGFDDAMVFNEQTANHGWAILTTSGNVWIGDTTGAIVDKGAALQVVASGGATGLRITGDTTLIRTGTALSNNAGVAAGTLLNAPTAGNPSKWIAINDNGTVRKIPTWL